VVAWFFSEQRIIKEEKRTDGNEEKGVGQ